MTVQHSTSAIATLEYKDQGKYPELKPRWIKEKQLLGFYNSMNRFFSESLDELTIPKRFSKEKLRQFLMNGVKKRLNKDTEFRKLLIKLGENYPRFPIESSQASNYIRLLKIFSRHVALAGYRLNEEYAFGSYISDIPYIVFSDLILGNYAVSYFHEYKARTTEQHFRSHHMLFRGRPHLKSRKIALNSYFEMMRPTEKMFKTTLKSQFKVWLFIILSNSKEIQDFAKKPDFLSQKNIDQEEFKKLMRAHSKQLEKFRRLLFQLDPELFKPSTDIDDPTQTMWRDMVLLRLTK